MGGSKISLASRTGCRGESTSVIFDFSRGNGVRDVSISTRCSAKRVLRGTNLGAMLNVKAMFIMLVFVSFVVCLLKCVPGLRRGLTGGSGGIRRGGRTPMRTTPTPMTTTRSSTRLMTMVTTTVTTTRKASASKFIIHSVGEEGSGE